MTYQGWAMLAILGFFIVLYSEYRKKYYLKHPNSAFTKWTRW